jgi:16S rRNA (guanine527-N7)-methyltransferase
MSLDPEQIGELLRPYIANAPPAAADWPRIYGQLATYLKLILKWNARTNLTGIRSPEEIVRRHFGESLFAGLHLGICGSLLDFGSGAGFPGLPIQVLRPELRVTLAESRQKKASFLREVIRTLGLGTEVWPERVEDMPAARSFSVVTMRAVDEMQQAVVAAAPCAAERLMVLGTRFAAYPALAAEFSEPEIIKIPESDGRVLLTFRRRGPAESSTETDSDT